MSDLTGLVFGDRIVISRAGKTSAREWLYLCRCRCGREDVIRGNAVRSGASTKCKACSAAITKNRTTHGISKTPIYSSWKGMMHRCYMPNVPEYKNYGGRGIYVCKEWHEPYVFYDWALSNGWEKGLSIDRINVDDGYHAANCRWATFAQQRENVQLITRANKSGYRGVSKKHGRGVWLSRITVAGNTVHLGHHQSALEAALAHDKYVCENGLLRPVNFPDPYEIEARKAEHL